jgi:hypothetical protein
MPGLIRGMARTAAVVGTATATRNAVNRRQADKNYAAYEHAAQQSAPPPQAAPPPQQYAAPAPPPPEQYYQAPAQAAQEDVVTQLERLGALKQQGLLTDAEFDAQKKKLLGM